MTRYAIIDKGRRVSFGDKSELGADKPQMRLKYVIAGEKAAVLGALSEVEEIRDTDACFSDGKTECTLTVCDDVREKIFDCLSRHRLPILICTVLGNDLENTFLDMTDGGADKRRGRERK